MKFQFLSALLLALLPTNLLADLPAKPERMITLKQAGLPSQAVASHDIQRITPTDPRARIGSLTASASDLLGDEPALLPGHWMRDVLEAYTRALKDNKFLVLYFRNDSCNWCARLDNDLASNRDLINFRDCAIFAVAEESRDKAAAAIGTALGISHYPALTLLYPNTTTISEAARLEGYLEPMKYTQYLKDALLQASINEEAPQAYQDNPVRACPALAKFRMKIAD